MILNVFLVILSRGFLLIEKIIFLSSIFRNLDEFKER